MKLDWVLAWLVASSFGLSGCASAPSAESARHQVQAQAAPEPVTVYRDGRFLVSAQPDEATIRAVHAEGVGTIISCRSDEEMAELGFDEPALAQSLGMRYVHVPMGRDHGYSPDQLATFTRAMRESDGPVYVHCASGGRARTAVMAYLIREQGYSVNEARNAAVRLGEDRPALDQMLGETVVYGLTDRDLERAR